MGTAGKSALLNKIKYTSTVNLRKQCTSVTSIWTEAGRHDDHNNAMFWLFVAISSDWWEPSLFECFSRFALIKWMTHHSKMVITWELSQSCKTVTTKGLIKKSTKQQTDNLKFNRHESCNFQPWSEGDNVLGTVVSVRPLPLSWLIRLTFDLHLLHGGWRSHRWNVLHMDPKFGEGVDLDKWVLWGVGRLSILRHFHSALLMAREIAVNRATNIHYWTMLLIYVSKII